jgi:Glycosyltransferase
MEEALLRVVGGKKAGARKVVARVGLETDTPRSIKYRYALRHWTDAVVVNADRIAASFSGIDGFDPGNVIVIHNGVVTPERRSPTGTLRRELGIPLDGFVVGTIARLASQKRLDRLLRAFARLPGNTHCIIAGHGEEKNALTLLTGALGITSRVHFLGHRENKGDVLDALDVFVISSDREGMSNAMLEAMAFGLPVVSTPVSGAAEALTAHFNGFAPGLITSFDESSITDSIDTLRADTHMRQSMGKSAGSIASTRFSLDRMLDQWETVLRPGHP